MSQNMTLNGTVYAFPTNLETNWGLVVTNWAAAVSAHTLQKTGGSFPLTSEVDFGANYGLKSAYFKSRGTNPATSGVARFANAESVMWRNAANDSDLPLKVNASDELEFNGIKISSSTPLTANRAMVTDGSGNETVSAVTDTELGYVSGVTSAIQTQLDAKQAAGSYLTALTGDVAATGPGSATATIQAGAVDNSKVSNSAAIAYSKLNLSGSVVNADVSTGASIAYSKLNLATSIVNADVSGSAAVAYSKLNLSTSIVNADVSTSAAIARSKIAAGTNYRILANSSAGAMSENAALTSAHVVYVDSNGQLVGESTLSKSRGGAGASMASVTFPSSGTIAIDPLTTKGDLLVRSSTTPTRVAVGSDGQALIADSSQTLGVKWGTAATSNAVVQTKTTTFTASTSDDLYSCSASGGAYTVTLPTAVGASGKSLTFIKTDSTFNAITVDGNASETINGSLTTTLNTQYERLEIVSDGANWLIKSRTYPAEFVSGTVTWTSSGTAPVINNGAAGGWWRREGDCIHVVINIESGTTTTYGSTNAWRVSFSPSGNSFVVDTAKLYATGSNDVIHTGSASASIVGTPTRYTGRLSLSSTTNAEITMFSHNSTLNWANNQPSTWSTGTADQVVWIEYTLPVVGWKG